MRQILFIVLLLLIVDSVSLKQGREERPDDGTNKKSRDINAPVGKTAKPGSHNEDDSSVQEKTLGDKGRGAGVMGHIGNPHIDGRPSRSQSDGGAARPEDENRQSAKDDAKQKKSKSDKYATGPIAKKFNPGEDGNEKKSNGPISGSDVDPAEPKKLQPKEGQAGPSAKTSNDGKDEPAKESLPSGKEQKPTGNDDSKPSHGKSDTPKVTDSEVGDEDDDEDQGVRYSKSDAADPPRGDKKETQESVKTIGKVGPPVEASSSSSFVTYFIIAAVVVIVIYLVFHNKKKLMAYVIEGRNTGRARRSRGAPGAEYKPLNNSEDSTGCRTESA